MNTKKEKKRKEKKERKKTKERKRTQNANQTCEHAHLRRATTANDTLPHSQHARHHAAQCGLRVCAERHSHRLATTKQLTQRYELQLLREVPFRRTASAR